nr:unnamed protein product [Digitaria exilis]
MTCTPPRTTKRREQTPLWPRRRRRPVTPRGGGTSTVTTSSHPRTTLATPEPAQLPLLRRYRHRRRPPPPVTTTAAVTEAAQIPKRQLRAPKDTASAARYRAVRIIGALRGWPPGAAAGESEEVVAAVPNGRVYTGGPASDGWASDAAVWRVAGNDVWARRENAPMTGGAACNGTGTFVQCGGGLQPCRHDHPLPTPSRDSPTPLLECRRASRHRSSPPLPTPRLRLTLPGPTCHRPPPPAPARPPFTDLYLRGTGRGILAVMPPPHPHPSARAVAG